MRRTPLFLMANLGTEIVRIFSFQEKGDRELANRSAERALKIIAELTTQKESEGAAREAEILKMVVEDSISKETELHNNKREWESFFLPFAIKAMQS